MGEASAGGEALVTPCTHGGVEREAEEGAGWSLPSEQEGDR